MLHILTHIESFCLPLPLFAAHALQISFHCFYWFPAFVLEYIELYLDGGLIWLRPFWSAACAV